MFRIPKPSPCYLDHCEKLALTGIQRWRDGKRLLEWDSLHGHIEAYDKRGQHLGVLDAVTGRYISAAVKGRYIDV